MFVVLVVLHLLIAASLVGVVLLQRSEGGSLGGLGGGQGSFMTGRGAANVLTRTTAILFAAFLVTSVLLSVLGNTHSQKKSILDTVPDRKAIPTLPGAPLPSTLPAPASPPTPAPAKPGAPLPQ